MKVAVDHFAKAGKTMLEIKNNSSGLRLLSMELKTIDFRLYSFWFLTDFSWMF